MLSSSSYEATNATLGSPPPEMISLGIEFLAHEFQGTPSDHDAPHALTVITDGGAGVRVPLQLACHQIQQFCVQDSVQVLTRTPFNALGHVPGASPMHCPVLLTVPCEATGGPTGLWVSWVRGW